MLANSGNWKEVCPLTIPKLEGISPVSAFIRFQALIHLFGMNKETQGYLFTYIFRWVD